MKKIILIFLLFVVAINSKAQLQTTNYIYEVISDSSSYMSYNTESNTYQLDSIKGDSKIIRLIEHNKNVFIVLGDEITLLPYIKKQDAQILLTSHIDNMTVYSFMIAGIFISEEYLSNIKVFNKISFFRTVQSKHYYAKEFEDEFKQYKKRIIKIEKKTKDI